MSGHPPGWWRFLHDVLRNFRYLLRDDTSQNGEQRMLLNALSVPGRYMEIGCGHPVALNNTWALERQGWRGVSFDPQAHLAPLWRLYRPQADFQPLAITEERDEVVELHRFPGGWWGMSTLDGDRASRIGQQHGIDAVRETVPAICIDEAWTNFIKAHGAPPDLLLIDAEGADIALLERLVRGDSARDLPAFVLIEVLRGHLLSAEILEKFEEIDRRSPSVLLKAR